VIAMRIMRKDLEGGFRNQGCRVTPLPEDRASTRMFHRTLARSLPKARQPANRMASSNYWLFDPRWWWTQSHETGLRRSNSRLTGKITGNSRYCSLCCYFLDLSCSQFQCVKAKFPRRRNRELFSSNREASCVMRQTFTLGLPRKLELLHGVNVHIRPRMVLSVRIVG
jgi:hypothetical protein